MTGRANQHVVTFSFFKIHAKYLGAFALEDDDTMVVDPLISFLALVFSLLQAFGCACFDKAALSDFQIL